MRPNTIEKSTKHYVTTFYRFIPLHDPNKVAQAMNEKAQDLGILGLVILGPEGFNATCSCERFDQLKQWKEWVRSEFHCPDLFFKDSESHIQPFLKFVTKIRPEIVTLRTPDLVPQEGDNHHLSPEEWDRVLKEERENILLIDTRNRYEYKIGTFRGAINPEIDVFTEFPKFIATHNIPKDKKILIFCTGGIRCEKGILEMQRQGYKNTYQLKGGILNYLQQRPNSEFEGECFVFDYRVALDQNLQPSKRYSLCPHCGQPADQKITCKRCDFVTQICEDCAKIELLKNSCSKNCRHQLKLNPRARGRHQWLPFQSEVKKKYQKQKTGDCKSGHR